MSAFALLHKGQTFEFDTWPEFSELGFSPSPSDCTFYGDGEFERACLNWFTTAEEAVEFFNATEETPELMYCFEVDLPPERRTGCQLFKGSWTELAYQMLDESGAFEAIPRCYVNLEMWARDHLKVGDYREFEWQGEMYICTNVGQF